jgi:hypothetical protein
MRLFFFVVVDKFASVYTFPILGMKLAIRPLLHDGVVAFPAHQAFQESGLLIHQFCNMLFFHVPSFERQEL